MGEAFGSTSVTIRKGFEFDSLNKALIKMRTDLKETQFSDFTRWKRAAHNFGVVGVRSGIVKVCYDPIIGGQRRR